MRVTTGIRSLASFFTIIFATAVLLGFVLVPQAISANPTAWYLQYQNTNPPSTSYSNVAAVDSSTAWVGGEGVLKTVDSGVTWTSQGPGQIGSVADLTAVNSSIAWAVGMGFSSRAAIMNTGDGGTNWNAQFTSNDLEFHGVSAASSSVVWAVGFGFILNSTNGGTSWEFQKSDTNTPMNDVCAVNSKTAWVVGYQGLIMKTTDGGTTWNQQAAGTTANLYSVSASSSTNAWAVGDNHTILHTTNGTDWSVLSVGGQVLTGVTAVNANTAWVVGDAGTIIKTDDGGETARLQYIYPPVWLGGIDAVNSDTAWAVGGSGCIFHTVDGGDGNVPIPYTNACVTHVDGQTHGPVGAWVHVGGAYFGSSRGSSVVMFGSVPVTSYDYWSDSLIVCVIPDMPVPAQVPVTVVTPYGTSNPQTFTVSTPPPKVTSITPNWGYGGTVVSLTVTGSDFYNGSSVRLGSYTGSNISGFTTYVSPTQLNAIFILPTKSPIVWPPQPDPYGLYNVYVDNPGGSVGGLVNAFTVEQNPVLAACGVGAIGPIAGFGLLMGILSLASVRRRRRETLQSIYQVAIRYRGSQHRPTNFH